MSRLARELRGKFHQISSLLGPIEAYLKDLITQKSNATPFYE